MDKLAKKLQQLRKAAEQAMPSIKSPKPPKAPTSDSIQAPKAPKATAPTSSKDPKKVAEQLKDPNVKQDAIKEAKKLKEGVKFNSSGQWSLTKTREKLPYQKFKEFMESGDHALPDDFGHDDDSDKKHDPSHWGPKVKIDPKDIAHPDSDFPKDGNKAIVDGHLDYDYVRGQDDGRVYRKLMSGTPEWDHLNNKYLPTNLHETDHPDSKGSLKGADKMGTPFKRGRVLN